MAVLKRACGMVACAIVVAVPLAAQPGSAPAQSASSTATSAGPRLITLADLGFERGVEMRGLSGTRELFFALPPASQIQSLRLRLPYRSDSAFESRRSLTLEADGRVLYTMALPAGAASGTIDLPVDPALVRGGFLALRVVYSGAITEDRCVDQRLSGTFLALDQGGALIASLAPEAQDEVSEVAALMGGAVDIALPATPSEGQAAAAMTLALGNTRAQFGASPAAEAAGEGGWRRGRISFAGADAPALQLVRSGPVPEIRIGGADPAAAARLLRSRWQALAAAASLPSAARSTTSGGKTPDRLTFGDLGADTGVQEVVDRGSWSTTIPASALPPSTRMQGIVIDASVADDGGVTAPMVSVLMNGLLLGSAPVEDSRPVQLDLTIPEGLATTSNSVEVFVTRQVAGGDCIYAPQGYPAQVLPSSHVRLAPSGDPADFSDLASLFNGGFTLVSADRGLLSAAAALLRPLANGSAPVSVSFGPIPDAGPYVFIGRDAPAGTEPPLRFDQGRVELMGEDGLSIVDGQALQGLTAVQLLEDNGRPVLWIRPGQGFAQIAARAEPITLGYGDVALIGDSGVELAFSTQRDRLVDIHYPERTSFSQFLQRYRLWLIAGAWLLASIGFVYLLRRVYAARATSD